MPGEPASKRVVAFFDGQNLFHAAKKAFGHRFPSYDPSLLASQVARRQGWVLAETRFYTGFPEARDDAFWSHFWELKLSQMGRVGVHTFSRPLRYHSQLIALPGGGTAQARV